MSIDAKHCPLMVRIYQIIFVFSDVMLVNSVTYSQVSCVLAAIECFCGQDKLTFVHRKNTLCTLAQYWDFFLVCAFAFLFAQLFVLFWW